MASNIDPTKPESGNALTANVRANFQHAADEIGTLQSQAQNLDSSGVIDADSVDDSASTNKFTTAGDILKLAGIADGAEVNTVDSVNGATGVVVLDADDIDDSATTNKFATAAQLALADGSAQKSANLSDLASAGTARSNLGVAIGSDVQAYNATLADIAATGATLQVVTTVYTSSDTWNKPDNLISAEVTVIGGGGAGGGSGTTTASQTSAGAGGWSGAVAIKSIDAGDLSSTETVTVGAGGTGAADTTGGAGGASSFGSHCAAGGGTGGNRQTNSTDIITPPAGSAGTGTGGDINISSRPGAPSYVMAAGLRATGGNGADSILGAGGVGVGRGASDNNSVPGAAGVLGGGGGGAASGASAGAGAAGGDGGAGLVIVKEYRRPAP